MRGLQQTIARLRWGPLEGRRQRGIERLHDILADTPLRDRYWLFLGLLLGCIRDGGPIPWDRDADFAFLDRDLPAFLEALATLRRHGYELRPMQVNNDGRTTKWALRREGFKYEFFQVDQRGDRFRWHYHRRNPPTEIVNEVPAHGFARFQLYGRSFLVPEDADGQLTLLYGNWRQPDPGYLYWRDCKAIVSSEPWRHPRRSPPRPVAQSTRQSQK